MKRVYRYFLYALPVALIFSYFPVISLGGNETMNFELSVPIIWLGLFDLLGLVMVVLKYRSKLLYKVFGSALWWLFRSKKRQEGIAPRIYPHSGVLLS